jgi:glyoxylase-like metal-dependent hydrolase (beta-lactamase superfamily II)/ferredoxin
MARVDQVHTANAGGEWFVDTRCIDCDTCRQLAPDVFVRRGGQSVVGRQPGDPDAPDVVRASLACPTQSIGTFARRPRDPGLLPVEVADGVFYCGYNSPESYGANAFFVVRPEGNVLVDSPRFTRRLVEPFEALGGIAHVALTHRDDVADADRWAAHFGARVWIHADDASVAPFATDVFDGTVEIQPGLVAVPVPGHTRGSVAFVLEGRFLFSGDSLYWDDGAGDLAAHRHATWYSWRVQAASLARLAEDHRFEWVLAGHGGRGRRPADEMRRRLAALAARMVT